MFTLGITCGAVFVVLFGAGLEPRLADIDRSATTAQAIAGFQVPADSEPAAPPASEPVTATMVPTVAIARPPWRRYAVAAPLPSGRPMIAVVIDDLGLDQARSRRALALPGPLTLALLPYADGLTELAFAARQRGHELLVHVPMEPESDNVDPGPNVLSTRHDPSELRRLIDWSLTRFDEFVGINNHMGSRFTQDAPAMAIVLSDLKRRGLMFLDSQTGPHSIAATIARTIELPSARRDVFLDPDGRSSDVAAALEALEQVARRRGYAVGIGHPHDATLAALAEWLPALEARGLVLAPISAIAGLRVASADQAPVNLRVTAGPGGEANGFLSRAD